MIRSRTLTVYPLLTCLASVLLLAACDRDAEHSAARLEQRLQDTTRALEQSRKSLAAAERRIGVLEDELGRGVRTLGERSASTARLEQQLAGAHEHLRRSETLVQTIRRQRDQSVAHARRLHAESATLRAELADAGEEIRMLRARQGPDQQRLAELYQQGAAAAREADELRRHNAFLLRERGNLQAWLEDANAAREKQQDAGRRAQQELAQARQRSDTEKSAGEALRRELEQTQSRLAALEKARDALVEEAKALHEADTAALRAELGEARRTIASLRSAKEYLVEKIEACATPRASLGAHMATAPARLAPELDRPSRRASARAPRTRYTSGYFGVPSRDAFVRGTPTRPVAEEQARPPEGARRSKALEDARQSLEALRDDHEALKSKLATLEKECAAVKEQVQTLTWANDVLVKELETAYATGGAGKLPEGTRGIYVLRDGESLSRVAKAFYGDSGRWPDIVEANKTKIPNPDSIKAGTVILIPE